MSRWLPFPLLTAALLGTWLLLNESVTPGAILLGGVLSVGVVRAFLLLDPPDSHPPRSWRRRWATAFRLMTLVLGDVIRSNIAVTRIILSPRRGERVSGFLRIPLDMRAPYGLAALACIITATPGTIWVEYDSDDNTILLHILDLVEEGVWIDTIKGRYETRLMEIFE